MIVCVRPQPSCDFWEFARLHRSQPLLIKHAMYHIRLPMYSYLVLNYPSVMVNRDRLQNLLAVITGVQNERKSSRNIIDVLRLILFRD